jgi:hypothetical protein
MQETIIIMVAENHGHKVFSLKIFKPRTVILAVMAIRVNCIEVQVNISERMETYSSEISIGSSLSVFLYWFLQLDSYYKE